MSAKAGSMALTEMFLRHAGFNIDPTIGMHDNRRRFMQAVDLRPARIKKLLLGTGRRAFRAFKFVRNPYIRAVSSFLEVGFSRNGRLAEPFTDKPEALTFIQFLNGLSRLDLFTCNVHYRLQMLPYEEEIAPPFDAVVRIEQLEVALEELNRTFGLDLEPPQVVRSRRNQSASRIRSDAARIPFGDLRKAWPDYKHFYNNEARTLVSRLYGLDIDRYGYQAP